MPRSCIVESVSYGRRQGVEWLCRDVLQEVDRRRGAVGVFRPCFG